MDEYFKRILAAGCQGVMLWDGDRPGTVNGCLVRSWRPDHATNLWSSVDSVEEALAQLADKAESLQKKESHG